jgi:hypothetical protein
MHAEALHGLRQHREALDRALAAGRPCRPIAEHPPGQDGLEALADREPVEHVLVRIDLDRAGAGRAEVQALHLGAADPAAERKPRALNAERLVGQVVTKEHDHARDAIGAEDAVRMMPDDVGAVRELELPGVQITLGVRPMRVDSLVEEGERELLPTVVLLELTSLAGGPVGVALASGLVIYRRPLAGIYTAQAEPLAHMVEAIVPVIARETMHEKAVRRRCRQLDAEASIELAMPRSGREHLGAGNLATQDASDSAKVADHAAPRCSLRAQRRLTRTWRSSFGSTTPAGTAIGSARVCSCAQCNSALRNAHCIGVSDGRP